MRPLWRGVHAFGIPHVPWEEAGLNRLTPKMLGKMMVMRNGKKWNTKPERLFNEYQESRGMGLVQNVSLPFAGQHETLTFQLDFARPTDHTYDIDFEIDGKGHKDKWDRWKDEIKNRQGLKVIHIPGVLCEKKWWQVLDEQLPQAMISPTGSVYLLA